MDLKQFYQEHGNFRLFFKETYRGIKVRKWTAWKFFNDCSEEQINKANLMELTNDMVLLDLDTKDLYPKVLEELKKEGLSFSVYKTNRGFHIHLFFPQLLSDFNKVWEAKCKYQK